MSEPVFKRTTGGTIATVGRDLASTQGRSGLSQSTADQILAALGSALLCQSYDSAINVNDTDFAATMVSGRMYLNAVLLTEPAVVTGAVFRVAAAGVYTAAATGNRVGLYQVDEAGTGLTRLAQSATDGVLFKTVGVIQKPFTAPVTIESGLYFAALMWYASATTSAPRRSALTSVAPGVTNPLLTGKPQRASYYDGTEMPATIAGFGTTLSPLSWAGLY